MIVDRASGPLPFLGGLARSERREDRRLWLRVAADYILRADAADTVDSREFLADFTVCLAACEDFERLAIAKKLFSRAPMAPVLPPLFIDLGGEAAAFVLAHSPGLARGLLLSATLNPVRARAVARRGDLDVQLTAAIARSDDLETLAALAGNPLAILPPLLARDLAERARRNAAEPAGRQLADNLLARANNVVEMAPLFMQASAVQRIAILLATQRRELGRPRTSAPAAASPEQIEALERLAIAEEKEPFAAALAMILECEIALARQITDDRGGEPLAVTLAAIGAPNDVSVRILTAADLSDGADYPRVGALARLRDALNPLAARAVVGAIVGHDLAAVEEAPAPTERRVRSLPSERVTPAVLRRRLAFAFAASQSAKKE